MDPLIKSSTQSPRTQMYPEPSTRTHEEVAVSARRLPSRESGQVGTKLEPDSTTSTRSSQRRPANTEPTRRRSSKRVTYRDIRAYVRAHHLVSPRTGWIEHTTGEEVAGTCVRPGTGPRSRAHSDISGSCKGAILAQGVPGAPRRLNWRGIEVVGKGTETLAAFPRRGCAKEQQDDADQRRSPAKYPPAVDVSGCSWSRAGRSSIGPRPRTQVL